MSVSRITKLIREAVQTNSLADADSRRTFPVNIVVGEMDLKKAETMTLTAVELALRCFSGEIKLYFPSSMGGLMDVCMLASRRYNAEGRLRLMNGGPPHGEPTLGLGVQLRDEICADAVGWLAGVNRILSPASATSPAAIFAVSCSFAKLFNAWVLGRTKHAKESWMFSLLEFTSHPQLDIAAPSQIDLGTIGLIGAGAIGTAFAFTLSLSGWSTCIDVIDYDWYDDPNMETSLMIGRKDVLDHPFKSVRLAELLDSVENITANSVKAKISKGSPELDVERAVLISAVDNAETRRYLDKSGAKTLYNAGVGGTVRDAGHVLCSRHGVNDSYLSSLYSNTDEFTSSENLFPSEIEDECSRIAYQNASLAAPFIGLTAGALLVACCAQEALRACPSANYIKFDLFALQSRYQCSDLTRSLNTG